MKLPEITGLAVRSFPPRGKHSPAVKESARRLNRLRVFSVWKVFHVKHGAEKPAATRKIAVFSAQKIVIYL